jgi:probable phosphoglycerate mutase
MLFIVQVANCYKVKNMTRIYLTRHGETEWNLRKIMQGWQNSDLTDLGRQQAKWLGNRLSKIEFEAVYSSPLNRAVETAKIIKKDSFEDIIIKDHLKEMGFGPWEGKTSVEIEKDYKEAYSNFWEKPHLYAGEACESYYDVRDRVMPIVNEIIERHDDNVLIVTHTVIIKIIMAYFDARKMEDLWDPPFMHQTSLNIIEIENNQPKIILHGDTSHYRE